MTKYYATPQQVLDTYKALTFEQRLRLMVYAKRCTETSGLLKYESLLAVDAVKLWPHYRITTLLPSKQVFKEKICNDPLRYEYTTIDVPPLYEAAVHYVLKGIHAWPSEVIDLYGKLRFSIKNLAGQARDLCATAQRCYEEEIRGFKIQPLLSLDALETQDIPDDEGDFDPVVFGENIENEQIHQESNERWKNLNPAIIWENAENEQIYQKYEEHLKAVKSRIDQLWPEELAKMTTTQQQVFHLQQQNKNWTQIQISDHIGVNPSTISRAIKVLVPKYYEFRVKVTQNYIQEHLASTEKAKRKPKEGKTHA